MYPAYPNVFEIQFQVTLNSSMMGAPHSGVVYTMDHKVIIRPCKICDWLLNLSRDHFGLHLGQHVRVTMEFEVLKRHILKPTVYTDMVEQILRWERPKKNAMVVKGRDPWQRNVVIIDCQWKTFGKQKMQTREDKRMVDSILFVF